MTTFYHVQYVTTKDQMEIRKDVQAINKRVLWALLCADDASVVEEQQKDFEDRFSKIEQYIAVIDKNLNDSEKTQKLASTKSIVEPLAMAGGNFRGKFGSQRRTGRPVPESEKSGAAVSAENRSVRLKKHKYHLMNCRKCAKISAVC